MRYMMRALIVSLSLGWMVHAETAGAQALKPHAGMLRYPAISADRIVFRYANRLWIVSRDGGAALPLAAPSGSLAFPRFSPDGTKVAYLANYEGGNDLYVLPIEGGIPSRVTHHPSQEMLCGWLKSDRLLFSAGISGLSRQAQLYTVAPTGGLPIQLPVPYGALADISDDGKLLAYTPHTQDFATWKRYRGGMQTDIWLFDLTTRKSKRMTDWEGNDTAPMWIGGRVYYVTDAGKERRGNIWVYDPQNGKRSQITHYDDFDIKWPSKGPGPRGAGEIVFQHGAELCVLDVPTGKVRTVEVTIPGERPNLAARAVDASRFITGWGISSTGKQAVIEARGDIWTVPAKDGVPRNLTRSNGSNERDPAWSPDGRWIAYLSDAAGEYELYITQSDGRGDTRQLTRDGDRFRYAPTWSPDSSRLAFTDNSGALFVHTVANGETKLIDTDPWGDRPEPSWSPDSRWLAYALTDETPSLHSIRAYDLKNGQKHRLTSGMFEDTRPVFDRKGEYLYWVSGRSFQPTYEDFGTSWIYTDSETLMAASLKADMPSPYLPKVDQETWTETKTEKTAPAAVEIALSPDRTSSIPAARTVLAAEPDDPVSGAWSGTADAAPIGLGTISFTAQLTLTAGNAIQGSLVTPMGSSSITGSWNPDARKLTLTVPLPIGVVATITVTVTGNTAEGTAEAEGQVIRIRMTRDAAPKEKPEAPRTKPQGPAAPATGSREALNVVIDPAGFEGRAILLAPKPGAFGRLAVNDRNQLIFARRASLGGGDQPSIKLFDIKDDKKEEKLVAAGAQDFDISADGKKLLVVRGGSAAIQDASAGGSGTAVATAGMTVRIDPRVEWRQIFNEAWRTMRQFFYAPNMHGVDWPKMKAHYSAMLGDCASRDDLSYVIGELIGELNVGHAYYSGGDTGSQPSVSVGMLGADFEIKDGAYRFSRIYRGAPWDADARGPLGEPGLKIGEGDYLLAVNGIPIDTTMDPWAAFIGLADKTVSLTVSSKPIRDASARDVPVRLTSSDRDVRYRAWIERNRAYVEKKTGGRVGYIYVPNMGVAGQNDLVRQLVGQRGKAALIIDERWNGGGQVPHRFVELLERPLFNYWTGRYGQPTAWPPDAHRGPKCMLINGLAGSGGDLFPYYFRAAGIGKLIGTRTWGGVVGIGGFPALIDGAVVTTPNFAFFENEKKWGIEGHGVDPDIEVLDDPALMLEGGDPQLDAAIKLMLDSIQDRTYKPIARPPYPDRSGMGVPVRER